MSLKLDIYKGKKIEKTYEAEAGSILFGVLEDLMAVVELDNIKGMKTDMDILETFAPLIVEGIKQIKPLVLEVFEGLTEDELRRTRIEDLVPLVVEMITYAFSKVLGMSEGKTKK